MTTVVDKGYRVTPEQIEHMAREAGKGYAASETYLRCLIVAAQESTKRGVRAVNAAHEVFYPAVLKGVGGEGPEQHRRATFARTAASTLRGFIKAGGVLKSVDVSTATKGSLRKAGAPIEPVERNERSLARAVAQTVRTVRRMAKADVAAARARLEAAIADLEGVLTGLVVPTGTSRRTARGAGLRADTRHR